MSDNSSDNSGIWWIAIFTIGGGLWFFFDRTLWPSLESPVLRCLLAPIAGGIIMFFYSGAWVAPLLQLIWNFIKWLTSPGLVLLLCVLLVVGGGLALAFHWAPVPLTLPWAIAGAVAAGTLGGYIALRFASAVPHNPWHVKATLALPVAGGLSYWATTRLLNRVEPALYWTSIVMALLLVSRILWAEESMKAQVHTAQTQQLSSLRASDLPKDVREQLLEKIREQLGVTQYNQLISSMGEDGAIDLVLKQMSTGK